MGGGVEEGKRGKFLFSSLHLPLSSPFCSLPGFLDEIARKRLLAGSETPSTIKTSVFIGIEKLSWDCHAEMICKKVSAGIGAIRCIKNFVPVLWKQEEPSTEQPHSENCSPLWDEVHTT